MIEYFLLLAMEIALIFAATYTGARLGTKHGRRLSTVQTVETIKDAEGNLEYTIDIGCTGTRKHRQWFWKLDAKRKGASSVTGDMTIGGHRIEIEGGDDSTEVGAESAGGPKKTKEEAIAAALRALEVMR